MSKSQEQFKLGTEGITDVMVHMAKAIEHIEDPRVIELLILTLAEVAKETIGLANALDLAVQIEAL